MPETVLVADANIDFLDQTRAILERQSYQFIQAINGEDARFKLEQNEIDFFLVNARLPAMDGVELCQFVRQELQLPLPVALMVGQGNAYPPPEALDLADGLLVRPLRPQELLNCLHHLRVIRYFLQETMALREQIAQLEGGGAVASAAPQTPPPTPPPAAPPEPMPEALTATPAPKSAEPEEEEGPLYAMSWFRKMAALEVKRAIRFRHPLSLLLMAYDMTEEYLSAHPQETLEDLSDTLAHSVRSVIRDIDIPVQFSRDHILILLPNTDIEGAISAASRIKGAVTERLHQELMETHGTPPTISIGATTSSIRGRTSWRSTFRGQGSRLVGSVRHPRPAARA